MGKGILTIIKRIGCWVVRRSASTLKSNFKTAGFSGKGRIENMRAIGSTSVCLVIRLSSDGNFRANTSNEGCSFHIFKHQIQIINKAMNRRTIGRSDLQVKIPLFCPRDSKLRGAVFHLNS